MLNPYTLQLSQNGKLHTLVTLDSETSFKTAEMMLAELRIRAGMQKPPQLSAASQISSLDEHLPSDTPEKPEESLRNDSSASPSPKPFAQIILEGLEAQNDWIVGRDLAYKLGYSAYKQINRVQGELNRLHKIGVIQGRLKDSKVKEFFRLEEDREIPRPTKDPVSLTHNILEYLKLTPWTEANTISKALEADVAKVAKLLSQEFRRGTLIRRKLEADWAFQYAMSGAADDSGKAQTIADVYNATATTVETIKPQPNAKPFEAVKQTVEKVTPPPSNGKVQLSHEAQRVLSNLIAFGGKATYSEILIATKLDQIEVTRGFKHLKDAGRVRMQSSSPLVYEVVK